MKIYVFVDMEGCSGISGSEFVEQDGRLYQEGRRYYTWDINACVRGCFNAGAEDVLVRDGHASGSNILWEELDGRAEVVRGDGSPRRMPGLEECDALILLGYHARAGTPGALLDHTYSSRCIQNMWLNGRLVGEIGIDAGIASDLGLPAIMVSGDDKACGEAREWVPQIVACPVKVGIACQGARLLPMKEAHRLIEQKAAEAVARMGSIPPMEVSRPVTIRKEVVQRGRLPNSLGRPEIRILDGRTCEATADTVEQAFFRVM